MRVALVFLAACGLGPGPDASQPTAGAGTAPWRDLGAVSVCLGDQALGPPGSPPGGLCVSTDAVDATPCLADTECGSREACVCGRCTIAFCEVASDCAAPRVCNFSSHRCDIPCSSNLQCGDVEDCLASVCRGRCAKNSECQHGEFCDSTHTCITDDCNDPAACHAGERCELQRTPQQVLEPAPVVTGDGIVLYLDLAAPDMPDVRAIWRAVSGDGIHFRIDPGSPVIADARAPAAVVDGDRLYLYFEQADGAAIRVASSVDGVTFSAPTTVLGGSDLHAPAAVHIAGAVALYYQHAGGIGLATGGTEAPLDDHGLVLRPGDVSVGDGTPGTAFWIGITALASPHAIVAGPDGGQTIHLWFAGFGQESPPAQKFGQPTPIPPNFSIGFAAADLDQPDALSPWPYGPVADRVEVFLDHRDELGPAAVDTGDDRYLMYYIDAGPAMSAAGAAGPFDLGRLGVLGSGRP